MVILAFASGALAASISGQVLGDRGVAIPDAEVYAINPALQAARTTTDADGHYAFASLPSGSYRIWAKPVGDDPHVARYYPVASSYCDGAFVVVDPQSHVVDMELPIGTTLSGTVVQTDGSPIADVRIQGRSPAGASPRSTETDDQGEFHLVGLETEVLWQLQAVKTGLPVQWWGNTYEQDESPTIDPSADASVGLWQLLNGISVSGEISSPDGPVDDATVRVYAGRQLVQATTNVDGQFDAVGLPPGDVTAWATADGLAVTYFPNEDRPAEAIPAPNEDMAVEGVNISMPHQSVFRIQLTGEAPRTGGQLGGLTAMLYNDTRSVGRSAMTDTDGILIWDQLHPGTYDLLVYGGDAGHPDDWIRDSAGSIKTFEVGTETEQEPVLVHLPKAITLTGEVVNDDGQAVPGALVIVTPGHDEDTGAIEQEDALFIESTNAQGQYVLVGIPEGDWKVRAQINPNCEQDPGYVPSHWPGEEDPSMADNLPLSLDHPVEVVDFTLARDDDHDQMSDRWERRYQLDTSLDDAYEDPDNDGFNNLLEFRMRTDPHSPEGYWIVTRECGCATPTKPRSWIWTAPLLLGLIRRRASAELHTQAPHDDRTLIGSS